MGKNINTKLDFNHSRKESHMNGPRVKRFQQRAADLSKILKILKNISCYRKIGKMKAMYKSTVFSSRTLE